MRMRSLVSTAAAAAGALLWAGIAGAITCTPTNFYRDGINMTAAVIVSGAQDISGQTIDAGGCNIGIFYGPGSSGTVDSTFVSGANYFGILAAGDLNGNCPSATDPNNCPTSPGATSVDITNSSIYHIGEQSGFNGAQHGVAIYYHAFATGSSATGTVSGNDVYNYQKGGIVVNGPGSSASVSGNTVTGLGPVGFIAQNGIQIAYGAAGQIMRNTVTGNSYTGGGNSSTGILLFGGCGYPLVTGVQIVKNTIGSETLGGGNDIGIAAINLDSTTCSVAPTTASNVKVINNAITNDEKTNAIPYQAGISDCGVNDKLINNDISGSGYDPASGTGYLSIDISGCTTAAKVHANTVP